MNATTFRPVLGLLAAALFAQAFVSAADKDEFRVKRKEVYEFIEAPSVTREGDRVEIRFASKDFCDVTIAIEDSDGRIVRHLVSGVLGPKAPPPLAKDSLKQAVVWDGKDDQGKYVDDKDSHTVRVSLGLKPEYEKTLYWSPYKRISQATPCLGLTAEGVVVAEGSGHDSVKLFDHDGNYLRTIYPFPAGKEKDVKGLDWHEFRPGLSLPLKQPGYQHTLLTCGNNVDNHSHDRHGMAATGMAVQGARIAIVHRKLNRLATDGTSGGAELTGGATGVSTPYLRARDGNQKNVTVGPTSAAISPDGKWLYLAGYAFRPAYNFDCMHGVMRMPLDGQEDAKIFAGKLAFENGLAVGAGTKDGEFQNAASVACDAKGRVYVADYFNNRIQVFDAGGKHLKNLPAKLPALIRIDRATGAIYCFSWVLPSRLLQGAKPAIKIQPTMTRLGGFDDPAVKASYKLPLPVFGGHYLDYISIGSALFYTAEVDTKTNPPTIWIGLECRNNAEDSTFSSSSWQTTSWSGAAIKLLREKDGKLELVRDFGKDVTRDVVRAKPPTNKIQRLYVNPVTGKLYVAEADSGPTIKSSRQWIEIDPNSGKEKIVDLPFNAMEGAFDLNGYVYLRNTNVIARYTFPGFREVPWDYGEERQNVGDTIFGKYTTVVGGLAMPSKSPVCFHQGGFDVSPKGNIVASCAWRFVGISRTNFVGREERAMQESKDYKPAIFPGREVSSTSPCIHVWDKHGQLVYEDAVPGIGQLDGVSLDRDDNIYVMHTPARVVDGKPYFVKVTETLMKVRPAKAKILSAGAHTAVPLTEDLKPKREQDVSGRWVEGAEWYYGGVGFAGFSGPGCACWFSRFRLDLFARSIAPEPSQYGVAVVDSAGNLITRIGRMGNADSGGPKSALPVGDDGVTLFHPCYVGSHTDRRIFISDTGNERIVSVKVGYHAEKRVLLKDVPDRAQASVR